MAAASRRRAGPAARESGTSLDEQGRSRTGGGESTTSWGRASELGRAGEKQRRSRGEAEEEQDRREEQERRAGGGGPAAGTSEWRPLPSNPPALPSNPPALPSCGRARAWRRGNSSRAPIWRAKIGRAHARAHLAPRLRLPSAPTRRLEPPSAATRDYAPSRGDRLRPATRRA